ncbi:hypothetical protein B0H19DRAFT_1252414 [Mycena capillaripes]|nr:hypothetical protein B0H19DRAFT_1252414 [Mycena capillaripes]
MGPTVRDLILILQIFFPGDLSLEKALYVLGVVISLYPLLRLHLNQRRQPRQPIQSAWMKSILILLIGAFKSDTDTSPWASGIDRGDEYAASICADLSPLYTMLGLNPENLAAPSPVSPFPAPRPILCTPHLSCIFCPSADLNIVPTLRRREKAQKVRVMVLDNGFRWVEADLLIAHCATCRADYYPDRISYKDEDGRRRQRLEIAPAYLRISKQGVWAHRQVVAYQENALNRFHAGWSNFADWLNDSAASEQKMTYRQSQRLFIEHFSRRLLLFHGKAAEFSCSAHLSTRLLCEAVRIAIGSNAGVLETAMLHACVDCTHIKRYYSDLVEDRAVLGSNFDVAEMPPLPGGVDPEVLPADPVIVSIMPGAVNRLLGSGRHWDSLPADCLPMETSGS